MVALASIVLITAFPYLVAPAAIEARARVDEPSRGIPPQPDRSLDRSLPFVHSRIITSSLLPLPAQAAVEAQARVDELSAQFGRSLTKAEAAAAAAAGDAAALRAQLADLEALQAETIAGIRTPLVARVAELERELQGARRDTEREAGRAAAAQAAAAQVRRGGSCLIPVTPVTLCG